MPKVQVFFGVASSLLLMACLAGADPIPERATAPQLQEIAANPDATESVRVEALRRLAEREADSDEPWSGLPFYLKMEENAGSETFARKALSNALRCIKVRDGLAGVRTYLHKRIRTARSENERQRLKASLVELKRTLSSLKQPDERPPKPNSPDPIELEPSAQRPADDHGAITLESEPVEPRIADKEIALVLSRSAGRENVRAKLKEIGVDLDSVLRDSRAGKKASLPWKAVKVLLPENPAKEQVLTNILTSMLFSFCGELCAEKKYDLAAKECLAALGGMEGRDKLKVIGKLMEICAAKHSGAAPDLGIAEFQGWAAKLKDPKGKFYAHYHIARQWYKQKLYEKAAREFEEIVKRFPEEKMLPDVEFSLALCKLKLGDLDACVELLEDIADKHPNKPAAPQAIFAAGWAYLSRQRREKAVAKFRWLIKKYPDCEYVDKAERFIERFGK